MIIIKILVNQGTALLGSYFLYQLIATFIPVKENQFLQLLLFFINFVAIALPIYPNDATNVCFIFLFFSAAFLLFLKGPVIHKISLVLSLYPFIVALNFLLEDIGMRIWLAGGKMLALDYFLHGTAHLLRGLILVRHVSLFQLFVALCKNADPR